MASNDALVDMVASAIWTADPINQGMTWADAKRSADHWRTHGYPLVRDIDRTIAQARAALEVIASQETVARLTAALERHPLIPVKGQGSREFARSLAETAVQAITPFEGKRHGK